MMRPRKIEAKGIQQPQVSNFVAAVDLTPRYREIRFDILQIQNSRPERIARRMRLQYPAEFEVTISPRYEVVLCMAVLIFVV